MSHLAKCLSVSDTDIDTSLYRHKPVLIAATVLRQLKQVSYFLNFLFNQFDNFSFFMISSLPAFHQTPQNLLTLLNKKVQGTLHKNQFPAPPVTDIRTT